MLRIIVIRVVAAGLLMVCSTSLTVAQRLSVGGRFGLAASHAIFEDEINNGRTEPRLGFQIGGVAEKEFNRYAALRVELLYTEKGWSELDTGGGRRYGYVDVPLIASLRLPIFLTPYLSVGSFVAFEINCAVTGVPVVGSVSCDDPAVATSRKRTDYGVVGGIGLGHGLLDGRLLADLTIMLGLHDLNDEPVPPGYQRLAVVSLTARYMLPIGE